MSYFEFLKGFSLPAYIILGITALFFGWGVITLLTGKNDPIKINKGNKILLWTIIGFVIFTVGFLIFTLGGKLIIGKNIVNNPTAYQDEFPPAPADSPFPPPQQ